MSFVCTECGKRSHNPNDEAAGYCGNCHKFTGAPPPMYGAQNMLVVEFWKARAQKLDQILEGGKQSYRLALDQLRADGWYPMGTHADQPDAVIEFGEVYDETGLPEFERVLTHQLTPKDWLVTVRTIYGELIPQVVQGSNLPDALRNAAGLDFRVWFPDETDDVTP